MKYLVMKEDEQRKGPWLEEEDDQLAAAVALFGDRRWDTLAKASGLRRNGKSCRLRWMNYLRPNLKHGNISLEEEQLIIQLHHKWGNRWSKIARRLPGRTDNEIKNYWRSYSKKNGPLLEKETLSSATNTSPRSECGTMSPCPIKNDISDESCDATGVTRSPYEARLTEWMSNWPHDNKDDVFNCNLYSPEWIPDDCIDDATWDISLWDGE